MVSNETIGIAGVFVITLCLIALYHFIGMFGRTERRTALKIKQIRDPHQDRPQVHDLEKTLDNDNAWLLWSPDLDAKDPPKPGFGGRRNKVL